MSIVRYKRSELPPLTDECKAELRKLANRPDEEIDFSDIPPLEDDFWKNAVRNPFYRPVKIPTSIRIDADILAWLKGQGKGYQTRINEILRQAMLNSYSQKA